MKKVLRFFRWAAVTGAMMWMGYAGITHGTVWAWNTYRFLFWLSVVITFFIMVSKDTQKQLKDRGRSAPAYVDLATDIAQILFLAATGHFWMAGFWTYHTMVYNAVFEGTIGKKEEEKCAEPSSSQQ